MKADFMRKKNISEELQNLQLYIKRFCPEIPVATFNGKKYQSLSEEQIDKLLIKYLKMRVV